MHPLYASLVDQTPRPLPHWEHWSCPDAETYLTGIDYYDHPRLCRQRLSELYPQLSLPIPDSDEPKPRPKLDADGQSSNIDAQGHRHIRWGDSETGHWDWSLKLKDAEEVFRFSPLKQGDFREIPVVES